MNQMNRFPKPTFLSQVSNIMTSIQSVCQFNARRKFQLFNFNSAAEIPDMCAYQNKCIDTKSAGCYLSLIKRKKITRLDEKHLILMAEKRGLFGETSPKKERARIQSRSAKKEEHVAVQPVKIKRKRSEEIALLVGIYLCFARCTRSYSYQPLLIWPE